MSPLNRTNSDQTDAVGHFGWDVIAGFYKVRVERAGCVAADDHEQTFVETPAMVIPPPVTDLDLRLYCPVRVALPVKVTLIKPGTLFKFVAKGDFELPPLTDNPISEGGSLTFTGTTGGQTYTLPQACWRPIGPNGSKGYKCNDTICRSVVVKRNLLKAVCKLDTGNFSLPETGPVDIVLTIGDDSRYCAQCGGQTLGNPDVIFKRKDCPVAPSCP
jgi:hypothetical protein